MANNLTQVECNCLAYDVIVEREIAQRSSFRQLRLR